MRKLLIGAVVVALVGLAAPGFAFACDKEAAQTVQSNLRHLASWEHKNGRIEVRWGPVWYSKQDDDYRLALLKAFANADACLTGQARDVRFYSPSGKLVGVASPSSGVRVIK